MNKLMTHLVVGYPDLETTKKLLQHMIDAEVDSIELQIPFSDPLADGPKLMMANDKAVQSGVSVKETLDMLSKLDNKSTGLFIMSYLQPLLSFGPEKFFKLANEAGCQGYILPDLPYDAPEIDEFITIDQSFSRKYVPVLSPNMSEVRLDSIFEKLQPETVYITARAGITGEHTDQYSTELIDLVARVRKLSKAKIAVGFGIQTSLDVKNILKVADLAVVGSAVTAKLEHSLERAVDLVDKLAEAAS